MGADTSAAAKGKPRYRAVIVGCGKIGALFESEAKRAKPASHAGAVIQNPKTVLAALVDTNPKNLAAAGQMFPHAARYSSLSACLKNERPDIVVISTKKPSAEKDFIYASDNPMYRLTSKEAAKILTL